MFDSSSFARGGSGTYIIYIFMRLRIYRVYDDEESTSSSSHIHRCISKKKWSVYLFVYSFFIRLSPNLPLPLRHQNEHRYAGVELSSSSGNGEGGGGGRDSGLGLILTRSLKPSDVVIQVPTKLTLSVESPKDYNAVIERELFPSDPKVYRDAPWWAALSVQLNYHDKIVIIPTTTTTDNSANNRGGGPGGGTTTTDMGAWMRTLPRKYDTPIHWSESSLGELQYRPAIDAVSIQKRTWRREYDILASSSPDLFGSRVSYPDFVWGCETARSRAFSGAHSGRAFDPVPFATASALAAAYVGLGVGSWEQAANGAAMVACGSVLRDFVVPKLLRARRYVICPLIDMANHAGVGATGTVSFEYFSDGFSLSSSSSSSNIGSEMFIQYGPRSNDQLLQYYGFVERDNAHDVYILPPIREWDIFELERACGRKVGPGRLEKLDRAGLLGGGRADDDAADDDDSPSSSSSSSSSPRRRTTTTTTTGDSATEAANDIRGVVLTRAGGIDPAVVQAVRALISTEGEWEDAAEAIGNFASPVSPENERAANAAIRRAMEMELESKATTIEEDESLLTTTTTDDDDDDDGMMLLPVAFRLEKKKLLREAIRNMR